jgi:hypothetical protein
MLLGVLIFKGLTARRLYKSFDVKGLMLHLTRPSVVELGTNCGKKKSNTKCVAIFLINFTAVHRILIDIHSAVSHNKFY